MYTPHQLVAHFAILLIACYFKTLLQKEYRKISISIFPAFAG